MDRAVSSGAKGSEIRLRSYLYILSHTCLSSCSLKIWQNILSFIVAYIYTGRARARAWGGGKNVITNSCLVSQDCFLVSKKNVS